MQVVSHVAASHVLLVRFGKPDKRKNAVKVMLLISLEHPLNITKTERFSQNVSRTMLATANISPEKDKREG